MVGHFVWFSSWSWSAKPGGRQKGEALEGWTTAASEIDLGGWTTTKIIPKTTPATVKSRKKWMDNTKKNLLIVANEEKIVFLSYQ